MQSQHEFFNYNGGGKDRKKRNNILIEKFKILLFFVMKIIVNIKLIEL